MSPEVVRHDYYDTKADVWSLGVLLYEMLHGNAPFRGIREQDTLSKILDNKISFSSHISDDAKSLINTILAADSEKRPSVPEIMTHPWIKRIQKELGISDLAIPSTDQKPQQAEEVKGEATLGPVQQNGNVDHTAVAITPVQKDDIFDEIPRELLYGYPGFDTVQSSSRPGSIIIFL